MSEQKKVYVLMESVEADDNYYADYEFVVGVFSTNEKAEEAAKKLDDIYSGKLTAAAREYTGTHIVEWILDDLSDINEEVDSQHSITGEI